MHDHTTQTVRPARLLAAAAVLAAFATIAACGSSSPTGSSPSPSSGRAFASAKASSSVLAFSRCMRAHGVPNFPDLSNTGMRIEGNGQTMLVNGVAVNAPAFVAARTQCQRYLPSMPATPAETAQARQRGLDFARCMRSHGAPDFPDPKYFAGAHGNQVVYLPGVNPQSPAIQAGAKACGGGPKGP